MRWASSMPAIVVAAPVNVLNPAMDAQRLLMARWSCSITLLRYLFVRTSTLRQQGCAKERWGRRDSAVRPEQEGHRLAALIDGSIQVMPLATDTDVGLIHPPGSADRLGEPTPALLVLRHIAGDPSEDGGMGQANAALRHQLYQVPVGKTVRDIPAHAELDDIGVEHPPAIDQVAGDRLGHGT